jgi:hypothetical protein
MHGPAIRSSFYDNDIWSAVDAVIMTCYRYYFMIRIRCNKNNRAAIESTAMYPILPLFHKNKMQWHTPTILPRHTTHESGFNPKKTHTLCHIQEQEKQTKSARGLSTNARPGSGIHNHNQPQTTHTTHLNRIITSTSITFSTVHSR